MSWLKEFRLFFIVIIGLFLTIFGLLDIIFGTGLILITFIFYILLFIYTIYFIFLRKKKEEVLVSPFEEFEKSLTGELFHFKCPICNGFFAIKKSKSDNKKNIRMSCPDCGTIGVIPPNPAFVEEEIPEKKSIKANFKCNICGEGVSIWAEGKDLINNTKVFSCPFCGKTNTMTRF